MHPAPAKYVTHISLGMNNMIQVEILYQDLSRERLDVLDRVALNKVPKNGVLAVLLSAKKTGRDTRVNYIDSKDNYILIVKPVERIAALYGWDDHDGGWYRIDGPFASDGYSRSTIPPFLMPYKPDFDYWIFRGEQVESPIWETSKEIRSKMR